MLKGNVYYIKEKINHHTSLKKLRQGLPAPSQHRQFQPFVNQRHLHKIRGNLQSQTKVSRRLNPNNSTKARASSVDHNMEWQSMQHSLKMEKVFKRNSIGAQQKSDRFKQKIQLIPNFSSKLQYINQFWSSTAQRLSLPRKKQARDQSGVGKVEPSSKRIQFERHKTRQLKPPVSELTGNKQFLQGLFKGYVRSRMFSLHS